MLLVVLPFDLGRHSDFEYVGQNGAKQYVRVRRPRLWRRCVLLDLGGHPRL